MTHIILVRHGETTGNSEHRWSGFTNDPLSELGREQARKVAARLAAEPVAAVYSSDLDRAYETAAIIAREHGLAVEKMPGLREINFGEWDGLPGEELRAKYGEAVDRWRADPVECRAPGGECYREVRERVIEALGEIAARHPAETVVIVAHGGPIAAVLSQWLGREFWECALPNTGYCRIDFALDEVTVTSPRETGHLEEKADQPDTASQEEGEGKEC